ncbi:DnaJ domain-containing protein [Dictyobacter kobayashii]|uniref:J domain-containing protein n=1 Tax=Dictyobacter kobayashii TaxID=2014872 RepID=A0A402AF81_9CHLR|nr:DnaJ domain-containing protein [Dictyobacter kobayashii]GCE17761.1 hypothetical protein KDK_15610 [Dictyobacter kobayashii]
MNTFTDYYALLGVASDASPSTIKAAFKKKALQYHPDVYDGVDANERMGQILEAYQTLNDPVTRKQYDARRSEHLLDGQGGRSHVSSSRFSDVPRPETTVRTAGRKAANVDVTPDARRDRQRHYAFPTLTVDKAAKINLVDIDYTLAPADARSLALEGLLRGIAPKAQEGKYFCHRCHHRWQSQSQPRYCPNCQALDWSEFLLLRCVHCRAVFESEQIRYEIGSYSYGPGKHPELGGLCPPYELFPLCPYCGTARWSPAEDQRVSELRHKASQKALLMRALWISVFLGIIILIALVALGGH